MSEFRVTLTITAGPHQGNAFSFAEHDTFLVGRSAEAHFSLPEDPYFSRLHFLVEVNPPLCRLLDLRSHNRTFLNGRPIAAADLAQGDEIRAGRTVLRVGIEKRGGTTSLDQARTLTDVSKIAQLSSGEDFTLHSVNLPSLPYFSDSSVPSIPGFQIERSLGAGGMGVVWLARQLEDGDRVAIKTIRPASVPEPLIVQRFLREATILQRLDHPNIVRYRGQGACEDLLYFVMDYIEGTDASRLLKANGPLPIPRAVHLVCQMLDGLAYAHKVNLVHRDIKPANLLVTQVGGKEIAKLADFGLARVYQASPFSGLTLTGAMGGTPAFMAPEQVRNFREVTPAADQYATVATLYTLLTGRAVHEEPGSTEGMFKRILLHEVEPVETYRKDVPPKLAALIRRGLSKKPEERFADVQACRRELSCFCE